MNEILTLSVTCISGRYLSQAYRCVMALPAEYTLDELASYILEAVDFDGDHLSGFYLANSPRGKKHCLTTSGEWAEDTDVAETRLCDIFPLEKNKKLYYEYAPGASWRFEIVKKGPQTNAAARQSYPCLVLEEGVKPQEYGADDDDDDDDGSW